MDKLIDFIKEFQPFKLDVKLNQVLIYFALIVLGLFLFHWILKYLPANTAKIIKSFIKWTISALFYGLIILILLNSILTKNYAPIIILIIIFVSSRIDKWLKMYDNYIDQKINKRANK